MSEGNERWSIDCEIKAERLETIVNPPVKIAADGITNFHWKEDCLEVNTVESSDAMVVDQTVLPSAFEKYNVFCEEDEKIVFGTRCITISNLLKAAKPDDIVSLRLEQESNRMKIKFGDVNYELSGVVPEGVDEPQVPDLDHDVSAIVHSEVLERAYQVIGMISESVTFNIEFGQFQLTGKDDTDIAEIRVELESGEDEIMDRDRKCAAHIREISGAAEAKFRSEFVKNANDFIPEGCFEMYVSEDYPLEIKVDRGNGTIPTKIVIAPRMDA